MNEYILEISFMERLRIVCEVSDGMKYFVVMKVCKYWVKIVIEK